MKEISIYDVKMYMDVIKRIRFNIGLAFSCTVNKTKSVKIDVSSIDEGFFILNKGADRTVLNFGFPDELKVQLDEEHGLLIIEANEVASIDCLG